MVCTQKRIISSLPAPQIVRNEFRNTICQNDGIRYHALAFADHALRLKAAMLNLTAPFRTANGGHRRRSVLKAGILGLGGLTLSDLLRIRAQADQTSEYRARPTQKSVILLWQQGGPSHHETYDMKPEAVRDIRGPFSPIPTNVSGVEVCELLPMHAAIADKFTIIRSCSHNWNGHNDGIPMMVSGYPGWDEHRNESTNPELGAVVSRALGQVHEGLPVAVGMGARHYGYVPTTATGYWSDTYRPPTVDNGLNTGVNLDVHRLDNRRQLLGQIDQLRCRIDSGSLQAADNFQQQAFDIVTGVKARDAFDTSLEDKRTLTRYGDGWGRQALQARRLVEAGVSFVTVGVPGDSEIYNWDDHAVNGDLPTAMRQRLPRYDRVVTALIEDIHERNLDEDVMIVVTGEFGRTPKGNYRKGNSDGKINWGRDHWANAMSILVSGGGKPMGRILGATNSKGEHPVHGELSPQDIHATIYQHLGIDYKRTYNNSAGRPIHICYGDHIASWG